MQVRAPLILSQGDPAGIGPEITLKAWAVLRSSGPHFAIVGCLNTLRDQARAQSLPDPTAIQTLDQVRDVFPDALPVLDLPCPAPVTPGQSNISNGQQIIACLDQTIAIVACGAAAALVTNPIAKSVLYAAGFAHPGQTEHIAAAVVHMPNAGPRGPVMMLCSESFRVSLATIHAPLRQVPDLITTERVLHTIAVTYAALQKDFGIANPRIAVCGLNPHAGEDGALGREEIEQIIPACETARAKGWAITGPLPADTLFHADSRTHYDGFVAMYHDQGLIPLKTVDFWGGVNVSLGLPIIRTSPDHGTGFNIAGQGVARPDSLIAALRLADDMARRRA